MDESKESLPREEVEAGSLELPKLRAMQAALEIAQEYGEEVAPVFKAPDNQLILLTTGTGPVEVGKSEKPDQSPYFAERQLVVDVTGGFWLMVRSDTSFKEGDGNVEPITLETALEVVQEAKDKGLRPHDNVYALPKDGSGGYHSEIPGVSYVRSVPYLKKGTADSSPGSYNDVLSVLEKTKAKAENN